MIKVLADQYLYNIASYLPKQVDLTLFDPAKGLPTELDTAHALLIRTVNTINKQALPHIPPQLSFVGTGSSGSDHVDIEYLRRNGITFANAPGCNARSVAEYVATSLLIWAEGRNINLRKLSVGIVGVGHVGTQVERLMNKLGVATVLYDPPREANDTAFTSAGLGEVLSCDILSFHTPLTANGPYPTYHWLDEKKLSNHRFKLLLNCARGGVVDEKALLKAMKKEIVEDIIIDTWENEPEFSLRIAEGAFLKTPHIAGYSVQSKENASRQVAGALLDHFKLSPPPDNKNSSHRMLNKEISAFETLSCLLAKLHPIKKYQAELQKIIDHNPAERGKLFNKLRSGFPLREEFAQTYLSASYFETFPVLEKLGFCLSGADSE